MKCVRSESKIRFKRCVPVTPVFWPPVDQNAIHIYHQRLNSQDSPSLRHQCMFARRRYAPTHASTTLVIINAPGFAHYVDGLSASRRFTATRCPAVLCGKPQNDVAGFALWDDPKKRRPDISNAKTVLGEPKVAVEDGLRETVRYFKGV